jgi:hypothetical protein
MPDAGEVAAEKSGSRIGVHDVETADGARAFYRFYDGQLGVDCYNSFSVNGTSRCVPWDVLGTSNRYADPGCSDLLAVGSCSMAGPPRYAAIYTGCGEAEYHPILGAFSGQLYYSAGHCGMDPSAPGSSTYYRIGSALPSSALVPVAVAPKPGSARLAPITAAFSDGASGPYGWHDTQLGVDCWFQAATDGTQRCFPTFFGSTGSFYADAGCTQPLASASSCWVSQTRYVVPAPASPPYGTVYATGSQHTGAAWFKSGAQCTPYTPPQGFLLLEVTPASIQSFVAGTLGVDAARSGSRVQVRVVSGPAGERQSGGFHDTQLGADCTFSVAADGKLRCLPTMGLVGTYYADPSCAQPLAWGAYGPAQYAASSDPTRCAPSQYYSLASSYAGSVYLKSGSSCFVGNSPPSLLYLVGAAVAVDRFAEGTVITR